MTTVHERAAEGLLDDYLADPDTSAALARMSGWLYSGTCNEQFVSIVGQTLHRPRYWPRHQVAAYMKVASRLAAGTIARKRIKVGHTPGSDADRAGNASSLLDVKAP
jgi:hypothetical protein